MRRCGCHHGEPEPHHPRVALVLPEHQFFKVAQKAFIDRGGQVLVVYFPDGGLDFPGGRIDEGESDLVASIQREVREETTLEIEVGAPFTTWLNAERTLFIVGYRCRYLAGDVVLSEEHGSHRWVDARSYREIDDGSAAFDMLSRYFDSA